MRDFITEHDLREKCIAYLEQQKENRERPRYYYELSPMIGKIKFIDNLNYNKICYANKKDIFEFYESDKEKIKNIIETLTSNQNNNNQESRWK